MRVCGLLPFEMALHSQVATLSLRFTFTGNIRLYHGIRPVEAAATNGHDGYNL
jgi:hypothetical protein